MKRDSDSVQTRFENLIGALQGSVQRFRERYAFTYLVDGEDKLLRITYGELDRRARAIAVELTRRGLAGKKALLLYPSGLDFITAFFGCLYARVVAIPAFPPRRNRNMNRLRAIAEDANPSIALTTTDASQRIKNLIVPDSELEQLDWFATDCADDALAECWQDPNLSPDQLAVLQYTSGSTGQPKGVMLTHANLLANCAVITEAFSSDSDDVIMTWLPTYHDMGLIGGIIEPIYLGCRVIKMSPMAFLQKPARWLQAITQHGVTVTGGPNFAYDLCTKKVTEEEIQSLDLSRLELLFNGAEHVRHKTLDAFTEKFSECGMNREVFHPCYGMAEASLMITGGGRADPPVASCFDADQLDDGFVVPAENEHSSARTLIGSGYVRSNFDIVIVDPTTEAPLPDGNVGEIWVSGPSVGEGYLNKPELTASTFRNSLAAHPGKQFLRTGDLGFVHEGQLYVSGRLKDMIIIRGMNKYPQDIEMTVESADPRLRTGSAAAFAIERSGREQLVIVAEAERIKNPNWDGVIQRVRTKVSEEHEIAPDAIVLIRAGSIPKTSSGKIQRHACRDGFLGESLLQIARWQRDDSTAAAGALDPLRSAPVLQAVFSSVRDVAKDRSGHLTAETSIVLMGLDSLERIDIARRVESALGVVFSEDELMQMETCGDVAAIAEQKLNSERSLGVHQAHYQVDSFPEYRQLKRNQRALATTEMPNPFFATHEGTAGATTVVGGRELVNFASYNYIGLSGDPDVNRAAQQAINIYGTSVSASRIVSGERPIHRQLETQIASMLGVDDALAFVGGHSTNETTIGHLLGSPDLIVHDALAHNSIIQGALLSGAQRRPFPHNDWAALDDILAMHRGSHRRVLIAVEGVYSMDGDYPNLPKFIEVAKRHRALLMVDEAHSAGTMGATGCGIGEHFDIERSDVDIWMGTLSKSFASCGGYIAGSGALVEYLRFTAPGFIYSVGMPPSSAAAALAAIRKMLADPARVQRCRKRASEFVTLARKLGLDTGESSGTPIVPVIVGCSKVSLALSHQLAKLGINAQPIIYPAVAESAARLRFFITSEHTESQIERAAYATAEQLAKLRGDETRLQQPSHFIDRPDVPGVSPKKAI